MKALTAERLEKLLNPPRNPWIHATLAKKLHRKDDRRKAATPRR